MPRNNSGRRVVPTGGGRTLDSASTSLLIVRYPAAIDTPPTIADDQTPLSGIFSNYLGLLCEAVMTELGDFESLRLANTTLMALLGVETANRISSWRSWTKSEGGNEAGQLFGVIRRLVSSTAAGYTNEQTVILQLRQGPHPNANHLPAVFCDVDGLGKTATQMVDGVGGGVRGYVFSQTSSALTVRYRGHPAGASPGAPVGSFAQSASVIIMNMVEA